MTTYFFEKVRRMIRMYNVFKITFLASVLTTSFAQENTDIKKDFVHQFTAGLEGFNYHYSESIEKRPDFIDDKGNLYGFNGAYQLSYKDRIFIRPEARFAYGFTTYTNDKNVQYNKNTTPNLLFEPRLLVGGVVSVSKSAQLFPYIGLGYRYKSDDSSQNRSYQNTTDSKRLSQYWYLPIGARIQVDLNQQWNVQGMLEYDWLMSGRQFQYRLRSYPSPLVFKQTRGMGLKGEILLGYQFEKVNLAAGPYVHYWKVKSTQRVASYAKDQTGRVYTGSTYEPDNVTREIGLKLTVTF